MTTREVQGTFYGADDQPAEGLAVTFRLSPNFRTSAGHYLTGMLTATADAMGQVTLDLVCGARYVVRAVGQKEFAILMPSEAGATLSLESLHTTLETPLTDAVQDAIDAAITAALADLVVDHGALDGLGDDDHSQYYNAARLATALLSYATTAALADEATARFDGDAALSDALVDEQAARQAADATLTTAVNARLTQAAGDLRYALLAHTHTLLANALGIRVSASGQAAAINAPWQSGDTLPAIKAGTYATGTQSALYAVAGAASAIQAIVTSGIGLFAQADSGNAFQAQAELGVPGVITKGGTSALQQTLLQLLFNPSSGTPAAGHGAGIRVQMKSSTTPSQDAGRLDWVWADATHATRTSHISGQTVKNGTLTEVVRVDALDSATDTSLTIRHNGTLKRVVVDGSGFLKVS